MKKRSKQPSQVPPLDDRHYLAIELMLGIEVNGRNVWLTKEQIANECGVSRMQLYRWEQRKDFQRELSKRRKQRFNRMYPGRDSFARMALNGDMSALITTLQAHSIL